MTLLMCLVQLHVTASMQVVIIRERVASDCTLIEAVQQLADVDASAAQGLLQLGAVYFGQQIKVGRQQRCQLQSGYSDRPKEQCNQASSIQAHCLKCCSTRIVTCTLCTLVP
jgi:hypothetical protein